MVTRKGGAEEVSACELVPPTPRHEIDAKIKKVQEVHNKYININIYLNLFKCVYHRA